MNVRDEVLSHIAEVMRRAESAGLNGLKATQAAFPGTPGSVLGEALWMLEEHRADDWWTSLEKTIDGEIIEAALLQNGGAR